MGYKSQRQHPTGQVGKDIVHDDQHGRQEVPDNAIEDRRDEERRRDNDHHDDHVCPCVLCELVQVHASFEAQDKHHKTCNTVYAGVK